MLHAAGSDGQVARIVGAYCCCLRTTYSNLQYVQIEIAVKTFSIMLKMHVPLRNPHSLGKGTKNQDNTEHKFLTCSRPSRVRWSASRPERKQRHQSSRSKLNVGHPGRFNVEKDAFSGDREFLRVGRSPRKATAAENRNTSEPPSTINTTMI